MREKTSLRSIGLEFLYQVFRPSVSRIDDRVNGIDVFIDEDQPVSIGRDTDRQYIIWIDTRFFDAASDRLDVCLPDIFAIPFRETFFRRGDGYLYRIGTDLISVRIEEGT